MKRYPIKGWTESRETNKGWWDNTELSTETESLFLLDTKGKESRLVSRPVAVGEGSPQTTGHKEFGVHIFSFKYFYFFKDIVPLSHDFCSL